MCVKATHGTGSAPASEVKGPDGNMFIGFCPNWQELTKADKSLVCDKRDRLKGKREQTRHRPAAVKSAKKTLSKLTREASSLKSLLKKAQSKRDASDDDGNDANDPQDNAGDQFGGRKAKKKKKGDKD
jgi:Ni,Fe-hydrogenase I large subunit